ncbi:MAG TPA: SRPBCC domain-containing protein [Pseudonocardiaceae bacterium]|nr:SRPBCC domain-containing protein [Pseudonocardiaceae bacterium]
MTHEFEVREEIELDATPEQVWDAIATGPGIDSWFMGNTEIEPKLGGRTQQRMGPQTGEATVTAWEPGKHFSYRTDAAPDGQFMAFEYLIEGRAGGSTVLRFVHSGLLDDDWEEQYDALKVGDRMYLEKLAAYLKHFPGRTSHYNLFQIGTPNPDSDAVWSAFSAVAGLGASVKAGDSARITLPGVSPTDGVVAFVRDRKYVGVRTDDGLFVFMHGWMHGVVAEYHSYLGATDEKETAQAVQDWLSSLA